VWATRSNWCPTSTLDHYLDILSETERIRASKLMHRNKQNEYIVAHAMLRNIIAGYLRCEPKEVRLTAGDHGKPACQHDTRLAFNLAHGRGTVLIAVANGHEVGVDIEQVRPVPDAEHIVRRYFCPEESERFLAMNKIGQDRAFFRLWTRKEAYLKSLGMGLAGSLNSFEVAFGVGEPFRLKRGEPGPWSLFHLEPFPGFVGALAVRGHVVRLSGGIIGHPESDIQHTKKSDWLEQSHDL
jgi:4'-phosphopantetheinyl transferase